MGLYPEKCFLSFSQETSNEFSSFVVVGGSVIDMIGQSRDPIIGNTSNPGTVVQRFGGVGRNVAQVIGKLNGRPQLLSAVGRDAQGETLLKFCRDNGIVRMMKIIIFFKLFFLIKT